MRDVATGAAAWKPDATHDALSRLFYTRRTKSIDRMPEVTHGSRGRATMPPPKFGHFDVVDSARTIVYFRRQA